MEIREIKTTASFVGTSSRTSRSRATARNGRSGTLCFRKAFGFSPEAAARKCAAFVRPNASRTKNRRSGRRTSISGIAKGRAANCEIDDAALIDTKDLLDVRDVESSCGVPGYSLRGFEKGRGRGHSNPRSTSGDTRDRILLSVQRGGQGSAYPKKPIGKNHFAILPR